jgi:hypothetical protein
MEANEIVQLIRNAMETAEHLSKVCRNGDENSREGYAWRARALQCRELLNQIPGTPEAKALGAMAARRGVDL